MTQTSLPADMPEYEDLSTHERGRSYLRPPVVPPRGSKLSSQSGFWASQDDEPHYTPMTSPVPSSKQPSIDETTGGYEDAL